MEKLTDNTILNCDSYKTSHFGFMEPGTTKQYSYVEARKGGEYDRAVFFGLQYFLKRHLSDRVTMEMVDDAEKFLSMHGLPFNREGWEYIVNECDGKLPLRIKAAPEGMLIPESNVMVTVENTDDNCAWVTSYVETALLRAVWYGTTVATRSFQFERLINDYLVQTGDPETTAFKFVDFGARGASSKESSEIAGAAHLINFMVSDNIVGILASMEYYNTKEMTAFSIPACYDEETYILTENGFKKFQDLDYDTKVAQYSEDGTIDFVYPTNIVDESYDGKMYEFSSSGCNGKINFKVTPNHRMVRRSKSTNNIEILEANKFTSSNRNLYVQAGKGNGSVTNNFSDLDALKVAFQADGSFPSRKDSYTGERTGTIPIRFTLKKQRKQERLEAILDRLGYNYNICNPVDRPEANLYWVTVPKDIVFGKNFDWINLSDVNYNWAVDFIEELSLWDGTIKADSIIYTSIVEECANKVNGIAALANYRSSLIKPIDNRKNRKQLYQVNICKSTNVRTGVNISKTEVDYVGRIGCVTVPSGMVVVRRNGAVAVSGNSEHTVTISWGGEERERDFFKNAVDVYGGECKMVSVVSDTYDFKNALDKWGSLREHIEKVGGTVVVRPDSGNPVKMVLMALRKLEEYFGSTTNDKGYRVLNPAVRIIQGDGINLQIVEKILHAMKGYGYSADNITFGCGGFLLQDVTRDTLRFAMKGSYVEVNGEARDVRKTTVTDPSKASKAGRLMLVKRYGVRYPITIKEDSKLDTDIDLMNTVFENGEIAKEWTFEEVRENLKKSKNS